MNITLIHGEEEFLIERAVQDLSNSCTPDEVLIFDAEEQLDDYYENLAAPIFGCSKRLFILNNVKSMPSVLPEGAHDALIMTCGKKPINDKSINKVINFSKLKSYDNKNEVLDWILKEGERLKIDLSKVANALFVSSGSCLRKLSSEIEKLSVLTEPNHQVPLDVARSLLCFSVELTPKSVIDAICEGRPNKALAFYESLQERNDETGWIIAYMQRHTLQQFRFNTMSKLGLSLDRMSDVLGIHPYVLTKTYRSYQDLWTSNSLVLSFQTLCDLDILHKSGTDVGCSLECEIIRLSEEAHNNVRQSRISG